MTKRLQKLRFQPSKVCYSTVATHPVSVGQIRWVYPIRPTFPQRGTLPFHTRLRSGLFLFFGDFSVFLNLSASRKSDFLFPANIFGGNPARSLVYIIPLGHGIAARSTPKQRKTSAFRCVFHTKRAIFDGSMPGKPRKHQKFESIID